MSTELPKPDLQLPLVGAEFERPNPELIERLQPVSSATATARLHKLGIKHTFMQGPIARQSGKKVIGVALTLQFMPQREDIVSGIEQEYVEKDSALWAVMEEVQAGDVLVIQADSDPYTGCLGEMLITYFKGRGGQGIVVDGYIRDWPRVKDIGVPMWTLGNTPHYASQNRLYPWAYRVPIACCKVLVLPGDIVIADEDGAVLIPAKVAPLLIDDAKAHEDWEVFSRMRLAEGGELKKYYPLSEEGEREYQEWQQKNGIDPR